MKWLLWLGELALGIWFLTEGEWLFGALAIVAFLGTGPFVLDEPKLDDKTTEAVLDQAQKDLESGKVKDSAAAKDVLRTAARAATGKLSEEEHEAFQARQEKRARESTIDRPPESGAG